MTIKYNDLADQDWPTEGYFNYWLQHASGGSLYGYHFGLLALDRGTYDAVSGRNDVHKLGSMAWEAYERGLVDLVQLKQDKGYYAYIAVRRWEHRHERN